MTGKSKIQLINKNNPITETFIWQEPKNKKESGKWKSIKETNYIININEEVGIISKNFHQHKLGSFYVVINKKDEVFFLDENDLILEKEFIIKDFLITLTIVPKFSQFLKNE